jgi:hypothetical protein
MRTRFHWLKLALPAFLAAALTSQCSAQQAPAPRLARVTIIKVKPDMLYEWLDLQKNEVIPAQKKGGIKSQTAYTTTLFGDGYEYITIMPFEKYAEFDEDQAPVLKALGVAGSARLGEKIRKCIVSTTTYVITAQPELSNIPEGATLRRIATTRIRAAPGRMDDLLNLIKSDVTPAFKKANLTLVVYRRGLGTNGNDISVSVPVDKYADLDGPPSLLKALGQDGLAKLQAKFAGMGAVLETIVRTRVDELSF